MKRLAKVEGPLFSIDADGKIAKSLIHMKRKGRHDVRRYVIPVNPKSDDQKTQRNFLKEAVYNWKNDGYTEIDIEAWNLYAKTYGDISSGYNMFLRHKINAMKEGKEWTKLYDYVVVNLTKVDANISIITPEETGARLYIGTSPKVMVRAIDGIFLENRYYYSIDELEPSTRYYMYVANRNNNVSRTGIYTIKTYSEEPGPPPEEIDIGVLGQVSWISVGVGNTRINKGNPAEKAGKITKVKVYVADHGDITDVKIGIFDMVGDNTFTTRSWQNVGTLEGGGEREVNVNLDVEEGDYIGIYWSGTGQIKYTAEEHYVGIWRIAGSQIPCTSKVFQLYYPRAIAVYGTGTTS